MGFVKGRLGLFLIMNCCVFWLSITACLPRSAHAEEELYWSISFEWENVWGDEGEERWRQGKQITYGAAWNFKTPEEAATAAYRECQKKARNPRNCERPGYEIQGVRMLKDYCWVIVRGNRGGYSTYEIYNNEREKAEAISGRDQVRPDSTFELMICGE